MQVHQAFTSCTFTDIILQWIFMILFFKAMWAWFHSVWKDTTQFLLGVMLHCVFPLCPHRPQQWSSVYHTIYSNLSLIKISAELWCPYWCYVLKWSSSSGKNWKPFHLRGLKGSKEHQITLPVVFLFFPLKLVTNCTFVGRGLCQAGAGGTALGFRLWRPCQLQNGVCFISPPDLRAQKEPRRKNREIYDTSRPSETPRLGNEEAANCRVSRKWRSLLYRGIFNTTIPTWGVNQGWYMERLKQISFALCLLFYFACYKSIPGCFFYMSVTWEWGRLSWAFHTFLTFSHS